jgi:hypothetical protein
MVTNPTLGEMFEIAGPFRPRILSVLQLTFSSPYILRHHFPRALIPKREVKKDRGRKLGMSDMIIEVVVGRVCRFRPRILSVLQLTFSSPYILRHHFPLPLCSIQQYAGRNGPAISNISPRVGFVCSPLHSRALIPKREVKKTDKPNPRRNVRDSRSVSSENSISATTNIFQPLHI